ncbi:MAG: hypothetical protein KAI29_29075, partial [Cyclobacteriaceae bacterium]|nr:hypothetical protein [Cyclobacteriaceae bacterium]
NRLDKLFKDQLSKHEEIPSPQAWDQIHGQLISKRRKVWGKRFAIAASILLFATAGFIGYRSLNTLTIKKDQFVTKSIDEDKIAKDQINAEEGIIEYKDSGEIKVKDDIKTDEPQKVITEVKSVEKIDETPSTTDSPIEKIEEKVLLVAEVKLDKHEIQNDIKVEEQEEIDEEPILREESTEVVLAENKVIIEQQEFQEIKEPKKTYPQVKIIYKADKNSELVASGKNTLIDKGINKITKFSDEHLLTADRKTKLRNTKEDLLALNFGKLLNKSN